MKFNYETNCSPKSSFFKYAELETELVRVIEENTDCEPYFYIFGDGEIIAIAYSRENALTIAETLAFHSKHQKIDVMCGEGLIEHYDIDR